MLPCNGNKSMTLHVLEMQWWSESRSPFVVNYVLNEGLGLQQVPHIDSCICCGTSNREQGRITLESWDNSEKHQSCICEAARFSSMPDPESRAARCV